MNSVKKFFNENIVAHLPSKTFKERHSLEKRIEESRNIMEKYPNRIPIICEKWGSDPDIPEIDRKKYLVPNDLSIGNFMYVIRKRLKMPAEKSLYIFIDDNIIPHTAGLVSNYYEKYKDEDGFLYISYSGESTFG